MEEILPFILGALVFGYQAYANYQKEKEKASKRNPAKPVKKVSQVDSKSLDRIELPEPARITKSKTTFPEKPVLTYSKKIKSKPNNTLQIEQLDHSKTHDSEQLEEFDLRKAVIHSIILERPYK